MPRKLVSMTLIATIGSFNAVAGTGLSTTASPNAATAPSACAMSKTGYTCPDAFVLKLSPDGTRLLFSTLLGGNGGSGAYQVKLNPVTGDLVVLGDKDTVFGSLNTSMEVLPATYRSHGSLHELSVPIVVHNCPAAPERSFYKNNLDLARWLYAA